MFGVYYAAFFFPPDISGLHLLAVDGIPDIPARVFDTEIRGKAYARGKGEKGEHHEKVTKLQQTRPK